MSEGLISQSIGPLMKDIREFSYYNQIGLKETQEILYDIDRDEGVWLYRMKFSPEAIKILIK